MRFFYAGYREGYASSRRVTVNVTQTGRQLITIDLENKESWKNGIIRKLRIDLPKGISKIYSLCDGTYLENIDGGGDWCQLTNLTENNEWFDQKHIKDFAIMDKYMIMTSNGIDPIVTNNSINIAPNTVDKIYVDLEVTQAGRVELFFAASGVLFSGGRRVSAVAHYPGRQTLIFHVGTHTQWNNGTIGRLRIDPPQGTTKIFGFCDTPMTPNYDQDESEEAFNCPENLLDGSCFEGAFGGFAGAVSDLSFSDEATTGNSGVLVENIRENWGGIRHLIKPILETHGKVAYDVSASFKTVEDTAVASIEMWAKINNRWVRLGDRITRSINAENWQELSGTIETNWSGTLQNAIIKFKTDARQNFYIDNATMDVATSEQLLTFDSNSLIIDESPGVTLYPNPVSDSEKLTMNIGIDANGSYTIYSASGVAVKSGSFNSGQIQTTVSNMASGLYIIKATTSNQEVQRKFIKI